MAIESGKNVTFTVSQVPRRDAQKKTIARLMKMQPSIQNGLRRLSKRRATKLNITRPRAGGEWTNRVRATKLVRVEQGATFTVAVTPHILPDLRSVEKFLSVKN